MPELPEVETVRRGLEPVMTGATITAVTLGRPNLRYPFPPRFAERLTGRTITALRRRAKYLLADLDDGAVLLAHLGMSGSFRIAGRTLGGPSAAPQRKTAHDHVILQLSPEAEVVYNDPRRFGFMDLIAGGEAASPHLAGLGPEPLSNHFGGDSLMAAFANRRTPLKAALLDQTVVAGLGNIYVCEALHRSGLSPFRAAGDLDEADCARLAGAIVAVLTAAVAAGGSTLRDHMTADGSLGYFQHAFTVYDRGGAPCPTPGCAGTIERTAQGGRSTFHCTTCQH